MERVGEFQYLGSILSEKGSSTPDIDRRIGLGIRKFAMLRKSIWSQPSISVKTKIEIYRVIVLSTVLYGAETWTCTDKEYAKLNVFHTKNLRKIIGKKRDEISNEDLYLETKMTSLEHMVKSYRLSWAGHVRRMRGMGPNGFSSDNPVNSQRVRWPKKMLFGELVDEGNPSRGKALFDWTKSFEKDLGDVNGLVDGIKVGTGNWAALAKDHKLWKKIREGILYLTPKRRTVK